MFRKVAASKPGCVSFLTSAMNRRAVAVVACVILSSASLMLHGCGGCDEDGAKKCGDAALGITCASYQKMIDCYKDCCDHEFKGTITLKGKDVIAAWVALGKILSCTSKDPCV